LASQVMTPSLLRRLPEDGSQVTSNMFSRPEYDLEQAKGICAGELTAISHKTSC